MNFVEMLYCLTKDSSISSTSRRVSTIATNSVAVNDVVPLLGFGATRHEMYVASKSKRQKKTL